MTMVVQRGTAVSPFIRPSVTAALFDQSHMAGVDDERVTYLTYLESSW